MGVPISNVTRRVVYAASGTGPYAFTFEILANTDIAVYKDDTLLTLTTDYTVTIASNGTGSITLVASPTGATQIAIVGNRTIQRTTDFVTGGDFFANTVNDEMDQQTIFAQQNAEGLQRALQAPQTDPTTINMTLPRAADRAGKYLAFDSNGNPEPGPTSANVDDVAAIASEIVTVAGIASNVTSVAGNATNINTVSSNISNVNAVGGSITNVNTVAGALTNINAVAGNASNINQVASDTVAINAASANATSAAASASAASTSASNAAASAAAANAVSLGNEPVRHSVRPSLLLDFANAKQLDPRITFTRASTATYYDGQTVAKAEENLLTYSQDLDNAAWAKSAATVTANTTTAPDGTSTAYTISEDTTTNQHLVQSQVAFSQSTPYTLSAYVKQGTAQYAYLGIRASSVSQNYVIAVVDLTAGTITKSQSGTSTSSAAYSITSIGSGWYRVTVTGSCDTSPPNRMAIGITNSGTPTISTSGLPNTHLGTGANIYAWGAQLEQRSAVTAYTPTTTQAITNYIPVLQTAASGAARFDHNPITGESLGLLIEESRTNLLTYSEQFDNAAWTKTNATITSNSVVAPDGTLSGDQFVESSTSASRNLRETVSITANATYTASIYAKAFANGATRYLRIQFENTGGTNGLRALFDLSTGTIALAATTYGTASGASATITSVGDGWYRCTLTGVVDSSATSAYLSCFLQATSASFTATYQGDGYSGLSFWGAQLEAGSFATSYIPTTSAQVTRAADAASMTGTNFSNWYRAEEGTLYAEAFSVGNDTADGIAAISDGTNNNRVILRRRGDTSVGVSIVVVGGTTMSNISSAGGSYVVGVFGKNAIGYAVDSFAYVLNGANAATDTSGAVPTSVNQLRIGADGDGASSLNGSIKKLAYYPKRLTNAELQGLTTV